MSRVVVSESNLFNEGILLWAQETLDQRILKVASVWRKECNGHPGHVHYQVFQAMLFFLRMNVSAGQMMSEPIQDRANDLVQEKDVDISVVHVC